MLNGPEFEYGVRGPYARSDGNIAKADNIRTFRIWGPKNPDPIWRFFACKLLGNPTVRDANVIVIENDFTVADTGMHVPTPLLEAAVETRYPRQWEVYCYPNATDHFNNASLADFIGSSLLQIAKTSAETSSNSA